MMRILLLLLVALQLLCGVNPQGELNEHLVVLSATEEGTAAIVVAWSPERGLGTDSRTSIFPFADGARVSEACTSSRCRGLVVIESGNHGYIIQALLQNAVGLMELQYDGQELLHVQNRTVTYPYSDRYYVPVDIISPSDATNGMSVVFFVDTERFSFGYVDITDIANPELISVNEITTMPPLDYQYISNLVYFPDGIDSQYLFISNGVFYTLQLRRGNLDSSTPPNIDGSCDRIAYNGDHAFYAYCDSEQASFTYDTSEKMIEALTSISDGGIPYVCTTSDSTFQVYLNTTDQSTVVEHDQRNFTTSGQNFTYGECYDGDTFFLVNDQGIKVFRPSDGSFSTISSSRSCSSGNLVVFDGPYLVAQGDDPPLVTLYDTSLQPIVAWSGSAMAAGVITDLRVVPSSTELTTPPITPPITPVPTTTSTESPTPILTVAELTGIIVLVVLILAVLVTTLLITVCCIKKRRRHLVENTYDLEHLKGSSTPSSSASDRSSNQDILVTNIADQTNPQADPQAGPQVDPLAGPQVDPLAGTQADPQAGTQADPQAGDPQADPQAGTQADPQAGDPQASLQASPPIVDQASPSSHNPPAHAYGTGDNTITPTAVNRIGNDHMVSYNISLTPNDTFTPEQVAENDANKLDTDNKINGRELKIRTIM